MSTPIAPLPQDSFAQFAPEPQPLAAAPSIDPDNPPWGVAAAVLMWMASVFVLGLIPFFTVAGYLSYRRIPMTQETLQKTLTVDPQGILASIAGVIPAHILTFALVWALVTGFGKRPFRETIGWRFGRSFGLWKSAGLAVLLLIQGWLILWVFGGGETEIDQIISSSVAARFTTAFLATATAPFVEELIYRGVLYSALQRAMGALWAIVGVSTLFALVHAWQYQNNLGVIATIAILSFALTFVRARTGKLLPCFIVHFVFNGIQSVFLVLQYFYPLQTTETKTGLLILLRQLAPLVAHARRLVL